MCQIILVISTYFKDRMDLFRASFMNNSKIMGVLNQSAPF